MVPAAMASGLNSGSTMASISPPAVAADVFRKSRREVDILVMISLLRSLVHFRGCRLDRGADAVIGATTAQVAAHRVVDVGIARILVLRQQRRCAHQLAGLAVTT